MGVHMVARDRLTGWAGWVEIVARCDRARVHCVWIVRDKVKVWSGVELDVDRSG